VAKRWNRGPARLACWFALATGVGALTAAGCTTTSSNYSRSARSYSFSHSGSRRTHKVTQGETVYHIAREYGVTPENLMVTNGLSDARNLAVGQILAIPGHPITTASVTGVPEGWFAPPAEKQFAWPVVAGVLSSPFGMRGGAMHEGIDIAAPAGTPVHAADYGTVIFAGRLHGYGDVVIVQHQGGYVTVYGHNQRNLVREGDRVSRGEQIAELGSTGRASGPNLHFEVRHKDHPQNPIAYLPAPGPSSGISFARNAGY
jgi:murein DD-endopeptidase MepM/ murein hydrolase activator NlpD